MRAYSETETELLTSKLKKCVLKFNPFFVCMFTLNLEAPPASPKYFLIILFSRFDFHDQRTPILNTFFLDILHDKKAGVNILLKARRNLVGINKPLSSG